MHSPDNTTQPPNLDRRLSQAAASSVFEESDSEGMSEHAEDENVELGHMQEILPGLWIGDIVAAMDEHALRSAGITSIVSIIRQQIPCPPGIKQLPLPIDDGPSTDILSHLPASVDWVHSAIHAGDGGVLVHCQAGMSRSATVVAAYLMRQLSVSPDEALAMIREKRHVIQPSDTFMEQLQLYYAAHCRVSTRDRTIRQYYMERNAAQVMNQGEPPEMDMMAKYPATPTPSMPATPAGGQGRRKIRCKMCRRHLATREHMMDHILDQSPLPRSRTPSTSLHLPSPLSASEDPSLNPLAMGTTPSAPDHQKDSVNAGTTAPGDSANARAQARRASESSSGPRKHLDADALAARLPPQLAALRAGVPSPQVKSPAVTSPFSVSSVMEMPAAQPSSPTIPPPAPSVHSRATSVGDRSSITSALAATIANSLGMSSASQSDSSEMPTAEGAVPRRNSIRKGRESFDLSEGPKNAARKLSMMALTPSERPQISLDTDVPPTAPAARRDSGASPNFATTAVPILVNPKCSGYFVEPLTWMEPMLAAGELQGKIVCPNQKCGAKIGSYDWAGVQCGCKEWVVPGFCISRSKVDEVW